MIVVRFNNKIKAVAIISYCVAGVIFGAVRIESYRGICLHKVAVERYLSRPTRPLLDGLASTLTSRWTIGRTTLSVLSCAREGSGCPHLCCQRRLYRS